MARKKTAVSSANMDAMRQNYQMGMMPGSGITSVAASAGSGKAPQKPGRRVKRMGNKAVTPGLGDLKKARKAAMAEKASVAVPKKVTAIKKPAVGPTNGLIKPVSVAPYKPVASNDGNMGKQIAAKPVVPKPAPAGGVVSSAPTSKNPATVKKSLAAKPIAATDLRVTRKKK